MHSALTAWLFRPYPETFPYAAVVDEFRRVGKHFVAPELLALLDRARHKLPAGHDPAAEQLARFLDFALDKYDGVYDNPSYIAIDLLPLPGTFAERDRLLAILVADVLRYELDRGTDKALVAKRCRLGLRALGPALSRLGIAAGDDARAVCAAVESDFDDAGAHCVRRLTALPVSRVHDEHMFIRMLQCYEATFALIAVKLRAAVAALTLGDGETAAHAISAAEQALAEAKPLWSLVATTCPQAFLTFREFTDGASAIQSRSYKLVESLCRQPEPARLDSPAYRSVPEVRERVLAGQPNVDQSLIDARASGRLHTDADALVVAAMDRFATTLARWRHSHYKLAVRLLGNRRGTGYTEGVPYLNEVRARRVFSATAA